MGHMGISHCPPKPKKENNAVVMLACVYVTRCFRSEKGKWEKEK